MANSKNGFILYKFYKEKRADGQGSKFLQYTRTTCKGVLLFEGRRSTNFSLASVSIQGEKCMTARLLELEAMTIDFQPKLSQFRFSHDL